MERSKEDVRNIPAMHYAAENPDGAAMSAHNSADDTQAARVTPARPFSPQVQIDVSAATHAGHVRANNEDHYLVARLGRTLETVDTSLPTGDVPDHTEEVSHVLVIADGMGGHAAGEVASRMAICSLIGLALDLPDWIFRMDEASSQEIADRSRMRFQRVGAMLVKRGQSDPALQGMGSTLTAVRSLGRDLQITHVGDSRVYLLRGGILHRLTHDHTYAQLLVDLGQLSPAEAVGSRHRHILTNALGGTTADVQVDVDRLQLEDGDRLLLCTDGLTDLVDEQAITSILREPIASRQTCERLIRRALDNGGRDNVTVIVATYRLPEGLASDQ
jgi:serine/threonine protein phosphatase PrpC